MAIKSDMAMAAANRAKKIAELNEGDVTQINAKIAKLESTVNSLQSAVNLLQTLVNDPQKGNSALDARLKAVEK